MEVQNYAFTTKSLYVGHMDYKYLRWQVIDSPGVLDRPLEERNTIEMQAITALAHLHCIVIFLLDLSPTCKYSIQDQVRLFLSLKPLWIKKPVILCANKTDLRRVCDLDEGDKLLLKRISDEPNVQIMEMSNLMEENTMEVRNTACDVLLKHRIHVKTQLNKVKNIANRIFVAHPKKRDDITRKPFIPPSVQAKRAANMELEEEEKRRTEKDLEAENGGFGTYNQDMRKFWKLKEDNWQYDAIPEVWNAKNIADFVDSDILEKLQQLEREEETILRNMGDAATGDQNDADMDLSEGEELLFDEIQFQKARVEQNHKEKFARNHAVRPRKIRERTLNGMEEHLEDLGYDLGTFMERANDVKAKAIEKLNEKNERERGRSAVRKALSREREDSAMRSKSRPRSRSVHARITKPAKGLATIRQTIASRKMLHRSLRKIGKLGRQGTADRHCANLRPKHLLTGKRGIGKTDWR